MPERPLHVVVADGQGRAVPRRSLSRWLAGMAPRAARNAEVVVALVSDRRMRALNRRFRGVARPTDVLSFPADTRPPADRGAAAAGDRRFLGDIVIATGVARRQAGDAGYPIDVELRRLALHGLLHLIGYDHERDHGEMARIERRLRRRGGVPED